jgi:hypothetical protein
MQKGESQTISDKIGASVKKKKKKRVGTQALL